MRILHVNKFLYRRGGAEAYMHEVAERQRTRGHDVAFFGAAHPQDAPLPYANTFPRGIDFDRALPGVRAKAAAFGRMLYSTSARRGIAELVQDFRPHVAHLHNIYHGLSPSILAPLAAADVPIVMTLHDYKLACPTYRFLDKGTICEACLGGRFHQAALRRCKDGSLLASTATAVELGLHTLTGAYDPIALFLCPSHFLADKMRQAGVYPDRLRVLNNFVDPEPLAAKDAPGGPLVFVGRLSHEKGMDVLLDALARVPDAELVVAGEGDQDAALRTQADRVAPGRVRFTGRVDKARVHELLRSGSALVLPSRWYENQPMSIIEAYACGVPVVATAHGGHVELVQDGETGWLVPPNDADALAGALRRVHDEPEEAMRRGGRARTVAETSFSPQDHLGRLEEYYAEAAAVTV